MTDAKPSVVAPAPEAPTATKTKRTRRKDAAAAVRKDTKAMQSLHSELVRISGEIRDSGLTAREDVDACEAIITDHRGELTKNVRDMELRIGELNAVAAHYAETGDLQVRRLMLAITAAKDSLADLSFQRQEFEKQHDEYMERRGIAKPVKPPKRHSALTNDPPAEDHPRQQSAENTTSNVRALRPGQTVGLDQRTQSEIDSLEYSGLSAAEKEDRLHAALEAMRDRHNNGEFELSRAIMPLGPGGASPPTEHDLSFLRRRQQEPLPPMQTRYLHEPRVPGFLRRLFATIRAWVARFRADTQPRVLPAELEITGEAG